MPTIAVLHLRRILFLGMITAACAEETLPSIRIAWTYEAPNKVAESAPGPENRIIVMLSEKSEKGMGQLVTLDAITGIELEGPFDISTLTDHPPRVRGTEIYAVGKIGKIHKYNLTGESLGSFPEKHLGVTSPIGFAPDGTIRIASTNGQLYGFDPADKTQKFVTSIDEGVNSPLAIHTDGTTYLASPLGRVEAVGPDGQKQFSVSTGELASGTSVGAHGVIVGHTTGVDNFDFSGTKLFSHQRAANVLGTRIRNDGEILAWGQDGVLELLSTTGKTQMRFRTLPESESNPPTISVGPAELGDSHFLVVDDTGMVFLLNKDGTQLVSFKLESAPREKSNLIMSEKGTIVVSVGNKIIGLTVVVPQG